MQILFPFKKRLGLALKTIISSMESSHLVVSPDPSLLKETKKYRLPPSYFVCETDELNGQKVLLSLPNRFWWNFGWKMRFGIRKQGRRQMLVKYYYSRFEKWRLEENISGKEWSKISLCTYNVSTNSMVCHQVAMTLLNDVR